MGKAIDPMGTIPLFTGGLRGDRTLSTVLFRCGMCNEPSVDEPGELCADCASAALTRKRRATRARRAAARKAVA